MNVHKFQEENVPKKFSIIYHFEWRKVTILIPLFLLTPPIETTNPLYEIKKGGGELCTMMTDSASMQHIWGGGGGPVKMSGLFKH